MKKTDQISLTCQAARWRKRFIFCSKGWPRQKTRAPRAAGPRPSCVSWGQASLVDARALLLSEGYGETTRCRTAVQLVVFDLPLVGRLLKTFPDLAPLLAHRLAETMGTDAGQLTTSRRRFGSRGDLIEDVLADMRRHPSRGAWSF